MPRHLIPFIGLALICAFVACSKSPSPAAPTSPTNPVTPPPVNPTQPAKTVTMNLNLLIDSDQTGSLTYEFIVSQAGGQVLLDTVTTSHGPLLATILAADSLVDVTTIARLPSDGSIYIYAYKGVNPSAWKTSVPLPQIQIPFPGTQSSASGEVSFTNVPPEPADAQANSGYFVFNSYHTEAWLYNYTPASNNLTVNYTYYPNFYNYLLLPNLGLYKLYKPSATFESIDLTTMDTTTTIPLNLPAGFVMAQGFGTVDSNIYLSQLMGIPDTTDLSKSVQLGPSVFMTVNNEANTYFQIPKTPMEKYETQISGYNSVNDAIYFYSYGNSVANTPVFPDANSFGTGARQSDSFAIKFSGTPPTYYSTQWRTTTYVSMVLYASPDSTVLHPTTYLNNLKSKLLTGVSLSGMFCATLQLETVAGFNYNSFLNYTSNATLRASQRVSSASLLYRAYY